MQQNRPNEFDVAIVGGGVAGTYAAWRIASTPADILNRIIRPSAGQVSIGLFEAERIGGRLLTLDMPGAFFRAELGGMRYTSSHILLRHVISHFGLHAKPFKF